MRNNIVSKDFTIFIRFLKDCNVYTVFFRNLIKHYISNVEMVKTMDKYSLHHLLESMENPFIANNIDWRPIAMKYDALIVKSYIQKMYEDTKRKRMELDAKRGVEPWFNRYSQPKSYKK